MPTRNINLTDAQDAYVEKMVANGTYQNASEAMRDALRALQQRAREDELKLEALRAAIRAGLDEYERGDYETVEIGQIDTYLEKLAASGRTKR